MKRILAAVEVAIAFVPPPTAEISVDAHRTRRSALGQRS